MRSLLWLRSDLRAADNTALVAAMRRPTVALYVVSPDEWAGHDVAPARVELILRTLRELSGSLAAINVPLLIRTVPRAGDVPTEVLDVASRLGCSEIHWNREYEVDEGRRDAETSRLCSGMGITAHAHHDQTAIAPDAPRTGEGRFYSVFTPFRKAWLRAWALGPSLPKPVPAQQRPLERLASDTVPSSILGFQSSVPATLWPGGEMEAHARLRRFAATGLGEYKSRRDLPAMPGTSTLSPYLAVGAISPRTCLSAACDAGGIRADQLGPESFDAMPEGPKTWISELIWREFYTHVLVGFPRVCMGRAFQPLTDRIRWAHNDEHLRAWQEGRTGIPIVDAGMRQLAATGWMHNRVRMITAMFLSKNLFLDWRTGETHFMRSLVDGSFASNNGGWQWSASTGTDAAPYFRVFNQFSQSVSNDPQGEYIRRWVPELAHLSARDIHQPSESLSPLARARVEYPSPIVDVGASRARAIEAFRGIRPSPV